MLVGKKADDEDQESAVKNAISEARKAKINLATSREENLCAERLAARATNEAS